MQNLRAFSTRMRDLSSSLPGSLAAFQKDVAVEIASAVIEATPILSGRAANNWVASIGSPPAQVAFQRRQRSPRNSRRTAVQGAYTTNGGLANIEGTLNGFGGGESIFISNYVPYIIKLERGESSQAAAGWIASAVAAVSATAATGVAIAKLQKSISGQG